MEIMILMEELLTPEEIAKKLKVSVYTVKEMLRDGELVGIKVRGQWRVRPEDYLNYINQPPKQDQNKK
jgi:excisionase family DNA binding protein